MAVVEEIVDLPVDEGTMAVVLYRDPEAAPQPAVVVLHDANGLYRGTMDIAKDLAGHGFVTAAPDTYHRVGRLQSGDPRAPQEDKMWLREGMTNDGHTSDMRVLARYLQEQPYVQSGPVGVTGFCLGGRVGFLAASRCEEYGPSVLFYPTRLHQSDPAVPDSPWPLEAAAGVTSPMLIFFPELDGQNPPDKIEVIRNALAAQPVESVVIEGAHHGFVQPAGAAYDAVNGPPAWERCIAFFSEHLKGGGA